MRTWPVSLPLRVFGPKLAHGVSRVTGKMPLERLTAGIRSACVSRSMGPASFDNESRDLIDVMCSLLAKAGFDIVLPPDANGQCCGMPF